MDSRDVHEESMDEQYKNHQKMDVHNKNDHPLNNHTLKGEWNHLKEAVKQKWTDLTDDDLNHIEGNHDKLVGRVQERYGHSKQDAERDVDEWRRDNQC